LIVDDENSLELMHDIDYCMEENSVKIVTHDITSLKELIKGFYCANLLILITAAKIGIDKYLVFMSMVS